MPSLPTSLILVGLVVAWLVVLVPMVAKRRDHVPDSEDNSARFRVLQRSSTSSGRPVLSRTAMGPREEDSESVGDEASDSVREEDWDSVVDEDWDSVGDEGLAESGRHRPGGTDEVSDEVSDEVGERADERFDGIGRRADADDEASEVRGEAGEVRAEAGEGTELADSAAPPAAMVSGRVEDDTAALSDDAVVGADRATDDVDRGADIGERVDDRRGSDLDRGGRHDVGEGLSDDAGWAWDEQRAYDAGESYDEQGAHHAREAYDDPRQYRPVPVRSGRGGYDPRIAQGARTYRFRQRRRVALVLLVLAALGATGGALGFRPGWVVCVAAGVPLVLYLAYLRRQVRIESEIRDRRAARFARARQVRPGSRPSVAEQVRAYRTGARPRAGAVGLTAGNYRAYSHMRRTVPPAAYLPGAPVDLDDDDPAFDELEYHRPELYRRRAG